jgi:hypothetical protein
LEGQTFVIKNKFDSSFKVVVDTTSGTIDGESSVTLSPSESLEVTSNGTNWVTLNETGRSLGAGCFDTEINSISSTFTAPPTNKINIWDQTATTNFAVIVNKTQNGVDITDFLLSLGEGVVNSGLVTLTDNSDNFCSFIVASVSTGSTYVAFNQQDGNVSGTLPENMDLGSAVFCFTPYTNGTSGSSGSSGSSGTSGSSGSSGTSGSSGSSGSSGTSGSSGSSGSSGTSGSSGSSGSSGTSGSSGSSGSSGTSGSSGSSGTSGSSGSSGSSGTSGSSGSSGSSGTSGSSGSSGSSGTSGSSGSSGTSGSSGSSGTSGSSGSSGTSGSSGSSGSSGTSGSSGSSGSSGTSGSSGSSGSSGTSGSSGSSGSSGTSGSSGSSGSSGTSGSSGSSGSSGTSGSSGSSGSSGTSGSSGSSGSSGTSGSSGSSGTSGSSGESPCITYQFCANGALCNSTGYIKFNANSPSTTTTVTVNDTPYANPDTSIINYLTGCTTDKGTLYLTSLSNTDKAIQFKFNSVTVNGSDVEFTVEEHSGNNTLPSNADNLCFSITCDGATGAQGGIDCLNQTLQYTNGTTPTEGGFSVNGGTIGTPNVGSIGALKWHQDAYIGGTLVKEGFTSFHNYNNGTNVRITFINMSDPTEWVTVTRASFAFNGANDIWYTPIGPIVIAKSDGFNNWSIGDKYCIYIQTLI